MCKNPRSQNAGHFRISPVSSSSWLLLFILILSFGAIAQDLPVTKPESVGLSSERLNRISATVQKTIDDHRIAGAVTLVVRHGQVAWFKAQGMQDRETAKPMRPDTIFRICSMSKPITSVAVMMLYEEGHFLLDDPVSRYLPEFKNPKVLVKPSTGIPYTIPATREITIRDLLRHTSGISYNWNADLGPLYKDADVGHGMLPYDGTIGDNVDRLAMMPLLFNPGERFEYGLNADVLGRLVEVVSGKTFDEFLRTRIFEPLGMKDTYFFPPDNKLDRLATAYTYYADKGLARFPETPITEGPFIYSADYPYHGAKKLFSGGAGLNSTAMDYARFCQMLLDGGKLGNVRILSRKSVELMTHDQLGKIAPDRDFGLGFGIDGIKAPLVELGTPGEFNWAGFFYTAFSIDPKEQMIVVFMGQLHPAGDLRLDHQVHELAYQAIID
jgi:CubicO group peptidase (beta-lactamase class C family)